MIVSPERTRDKGNEGKNKDGIARIAPQCMERIGGYTTLPPLYPLMRCGANITIIEGER